ncbi:MAG TPA: BREX-6 system adenine-specific DNA-methyltransferase PglX [Archangium sp.]|nr:BREX-6 system adenine-specific DNA-methyltransferase PglX [Archangium sp.]
MNGNSSARLTPDSKAALRKTIRSLRDVLLRDLRGYAEQRYLLNVPFKDAKPRLSQAMRERRRRLDSALDERAAEEGGSVEARARAMENAIKEAGATLLNRLVLIRHLEAVGLSRPAVVTGGWKSKGYQEFRDFAPGLIEDETQGYAILLQLLFDELAAQLPGLFGEVGLTSLFPAGPATLRAVIEALDGVPAEAWRDDMTLGWVYQYWNDPDREALDAKLNARGKLESHELASKTQMFTERYMVEWLLHNSLGPTWLAMCRKNGWQAEVEQRGVLQTLDERRAEWRKKREAGEVALDALMPIEGPLEEAWKYYVPQPLPEDVVKHAPASIRELKLLDPACGSGHFLVVAFDLLAELYREEARHRGESWNDRQIAEWILENNLHGVDIDPRAVQIAAAAIFLKARTLAKDASPSRVNLVAPALRLSALNRKDPALLKLERDIELETGIPPELTRQLLDVLSGVDHLGTLLKVGDAVDRAIEAYRGKLGKVRRQQELFAAAEEEKRIDVNREDAKRVVLERLNAFLAGHAGEEDLGLRLRGQQLTAGLRFASIVREGEYHLVVANPPYQGTSRMKNAGYIAKHYPRGKSDLYAAFLERGLDLCRPGGASAMVAMRSWMFLGQFKNLRTWVLSQHHLDIIADIGTGAFSSRSMDDIISAALTVVRQIHPGSKSIGIQAAPLADPTRDAGKPDRRRAALHAQTGVHEFSTHSLGAIDGSPVVYWWAQAELNEYKRRPKLIEVAPVRFGINTGNNTRFIRAHWEVPRHAVIVTRIDAPHRNTHVGSWAPLVGGAKGLAWIEPLREVVRSPNQCLEMRVFADFGTGGAFRSPQFHFRPGIAFSMIGNNFQARVHRYRSIIDAKGSSVFPSEHQLWPLVCSMNCTKAKNILSSLNPTISFQVGDVTRLPVFEIESTTAIRDRVCEEFDRAQRGTESSWEFSNPSGHQWTEVQEWAQAAIDRPAGTGLSAFRSEARAADANQKCSFHLGILLGRFGKNGEGTLTDAPPDALPRGILFCPERTPLDGSVYAALRTEWMQHARDFKSGTLEEWIRNEFFEYHRKRYENRPIYLPLSSARRSFIAFISIHQWTDATLNTLLSDHLVPERKAIEGALVDIQSARKDSDKKQRAAAEKNYVQHKKWLEELEDFIREVQEIAEKGPRAPDNKIERREADAPYRMDLDDGVMVNSAALWPLLEPMWKDPKKWWKELASAKGKKDYDWSHLAARYFPARVREKCQKDPSLAVAHGCFWKYHPEKAYQWELRLQDEIGPDFKLDEKDSDALRAAFLEKQSKRAREIEAAEQARRERKARKQDQEELDLSGAEDEELEDDEAVSA